MKTEWIEKLYSVLPIVKSTWNGTTMITGHNNIDLPALKSKKDIHWSAWTFDLNNHITKATWIGNKLIDHIISNIPASRILYSDVLTCPTISHHETTYITLHACWQIRNKIEINKDLKNFELEKNVIGFKVRPISSVTYP